MFGRLLSPLVVLMLLLAACSSDGEPRAGETESDTLAPPEGVEVASATTEPPPPPTLVGEVVNPLSVGMGDCINLYSWVEDDNRLEATTVVDCNGPHDREVFMATDFPADADAPYPGRALLDEHARESCYRAFQPFVGTAYELSELEIAFSVPPYENFVDPVARYRGILCFLYHPEGTPLVGTALATGR